MENIFGIPDRESLLYSKLVAVAIDLQPFFWRGVVQAQKLSEVEGNFDEDFFGPHYFRKNSAKILGVLNMNAQIFAWAKAHGVPHVRVEYVDVDNWTDYGPSHPIIVRASDSAKVITKSADSAFAAAEFRNYLGELKAQTIVLGGVKTHLCVSRTARAALRDGYGVIMPADAHADVAVGKVSVAKRLDTVRTSCALNTHSGMNLARMDWCVWKWLRVIEAANQSQKAYDGAIKSVGGVVPRPRKIAEEQGAALEAQGQ